MDLVSPSDLSPRFSFLPPLPLFLANAAFRGGPGRPAQRDISATLLLTQRSRKTGKGIDDEERESWQPLFSPSAWSLPAKGTPFSTLGISLFLLTLFALTYRFAHFWLALSRLDAFAVDRFIGKEIARPFLGRDASNFVTENANFGGMRLWNFK